MTTFTIDNANCFTALAPEGTVAEIPDEATPFTSDRELERLAADWPTERLVDYLERHLRRKESW